MIWSDFTENAMNRRHASQPCVKRFDPATEVLQASLRELRCRAGFQDFAIRPYNTSSKTMGGQVVFTVSYLNQHHEPG